MRGSKKTYALGALGLVLLAWWAMPKRGDGEPKKEVVAPAKLSPTAVAEKKPEAVSEAPSADAKTSQFQGDVLLAPEELTKEQKKVVQELSGRGWKVKVFKEPGGTFRLNIKGKDVDSKDDANLKFPIRPEDWREIEDELITTVNKDQDLEDDKTADEKKFIEEWKNRSRE